VSELQKPSKTRSISKSCSPTPELRNLARLVAQSVDLSLEVSKADLLIEIHEVANVEHNLDVIDLVFTEIHEVANVKHDFDVIDLLFTEINEVNLAPRLEEVPLSNKKPPNEEIGLNPEMKMIAS
jgi:hypothetical protein